MKKTLFLKMISRNRTMKSYILIDESEKEVYVTINIFSRQRYIVACGKWFGVVQPLTVMYRDHILLMFKLPLSHLSAIWILSSG